MIWNGSYTLGDSQETQITAGTGIKVTTPAAGQIQIAADETVLWQNTTNGLTSGSLVLSEPWNGFERIRLHVVDQFGWGGSCIEFDTTNFAGARTKHFACTYSFIVAGSPNKTYIRGVQLEFANNEYISGTSIGLETVFTPTSTIDSKTVTGGPTLIKVVGIGRKQ